jgi:hypothetical protein
MKTKLILVCPICMWHKNISHYSGDMYGAIETCDKCKSKIVVNPKNWKVIKE